MADQTRRLSPSILQADIDALAALKNIGGYTPANTNYTLAKMGDTQTSMADAQEAETQRQAELDTARDEATSAEWAFHNVILGAKDQVKAQYGPDSNEWQSLGLTKKSEKAKPRKLSTPVSAPVK